MVLYDFMRSLFYIELKNYMMILKRKVFTLIKCEDHEWKFVGMV